MSSTAISCANLTELVQALGYARLFNATLNPASSHPDLPANEIAILEKVTPNGHRFVFADSGFTFPGHGFIPYQDVEHASWGVYDHFDQKREYRNYLTIAFRDRPTIMIYVGSSGESVSLGGLIIMMRSITKKQANKALEPTATAPSAVARKLWRDR